MIQLKNAGPDIRDLEAVVVRFVGDSGDGMQLTGTQFTDTSAMFGNDVATFPNYPSEIRAPQGSLYGVSGYQVHIGSIEVSTPGDNVDLLVAMNPAGLKTNLYAVKPGHTIIVDSDAFTQKNLEKAEYGSNPLQDGSLQNYRVIEVAMTSLTREALKESRDTLKAQQDLTKVAESRIEALEADRQAIEQAAKDGASAISLLEDAARNRAAGARIELELLKSISE